MKNNSIYAALPLWYKRFYELSVYNKEPISHTLEHIKNLPYSHIRYNMETEGPLYYKERRGHEEKKKQVDRTLCSRTLLDP